jgi:hypothetical protein
MLLKHGTEQEPAVMLGAEVMPVLTRISFMRKDE